MHFTDVGRETKVLGDVGVVLWRVVAVGDEADPEVLARLELARFEDVFADELDVFRRGGDVGALGACAVLDEDEVSARGGWVVG